MDLQGPVGDILALGDQRLNTVNSVVAALPYAFAWRLLSPSLAAIPETCCVWGVLWLARNGQPQLGVACTKQNLRLPERCCGDWSQGASKVRGTERATALTFLR